MHKVYYVHFFIICVVFVVKFKKISLSYKIEDVGIGGDYPMFRTVSPIILFYLQKSVFWLSPMSALLKTGLIPCFNCAS